jgi:hypothetical protein
MVQRAAVKRSGRRRRTPYLAILAAAVASVSCGENPMSPTDTRQPPPAAPEAPRGGKSPASASSEQVLYDARDRTALPLEVQRAPKLPPDREALVLSTIAPSYKTAREQCTGASDVLLKITASANGAFTAPSLRQTAYVVASEHCEPQGREAAAATYLLVVEGEKVVAPAAGKGPSDGDAPAFVGVEIRGVADVDQDGVQDLLVTSSGPGRGTTVESARLYTAKGGAIKLLKEFPSMYVDGCRDGAKGKLEAHVLRYSPSTKGTVPQILNETYEAACPATGAPRAADFKPVAPPKPSPGPSASASPASPSPTPSPTNEP